MHRVSRDFQVFAKPVGSRCNLACRYCYYLGKGQLYPSAGPVRMTNDLLEEYIAQHIGASSEPVIRFSWHGGEPTLLGLDYFRNIVAIQRRHQPPGQRIENGIQTNGTLLDEEWCRFLAAEDFAVGLSLDGPRSTHDQHRVTRNQGPTYEQTIRGYELLRQHRVDCDILCVVNADNVQRPARLYQFFKQIGARYLTFLPLVNRQPGADSGVSPLSVPSEAWGDFLCTVFDKWMREDIGKVGVQIFEEAAQTAFGREHALCIFRRTCGDIPVVEHNGDFFSCDHFVEPGHHLGNILQTPLGELLDSPAQRAFGRAKLDRLPAYCVACDVRDMCNGECPKNRFLPAPDGEPGLNYLCAGYKRFFTACKPFVAALAVLHGDAVPQPGPPSEPGGGRPQPRAGRNDPCPCGSGRKYKVCCLGK